MPGVRLLTLNLKTGPKTYRLPTARGFLSSRLNGSAVLHAAALRGLLDAASRMLDDSLRGGQRALKLMAGAQPNKPMQPTANGAALIRKTWL